MSGRWGFGVATPRWPSIWAVGVTLAIVVGVVGVLALAAWGLR